VWALLLAPKAQAQFIQQGPKLFGTGAIGHAEQGFSVAVSGDGNTAIVGGFQDNSGDGAAWVYTRAAGVWSQQAKLVGTDAIGHATQGISVALSNDGNTAIVGGSDDNGALGAAWVFTRAAGVWSQQAKLVGTGAIGPVAAEQGFSVAVSGDGNTAIIGGPTDNDFIGAAWVFTRSGGIWSQQAKLVGTGVLQDEAAQGWSVSLSGDGNTAIVGGQADNSFIGAAWVFTRSGGMWSQQAKLVGTGVVGGVALQGTSVALSGDGNTAIVGGPLDNINEDFFAGPGAAWVFARSGGMWSQQAKLVGTGIVGGLAAQGNSVSLSGGGNTAIVGGPFDNSGIGAVWVFSRSRGVWSQQDDKLVGTGAAGGLGNSVSLSNDGNTALVGVPFDNASGGTPPGAALVFFRFAGAIGNANCFGQSVSALAREYGGLNNAAAALGYPSVGALQDAILAFCGS
jgi:hypothetical protein